jgi:IS5 family transposase
VEWPFRILKRVFGYPKVRYRSIVKNRHRHLAAFALVNLYRHRKKLSGMITPQLIPLGRSVSGDRETAFGEAKRGRIIHIYPSLCRPRRKLSPGERRPRYGAQKRWVNQSFRS